MIRLVLLFVLVVFVCGCADVLKSPENPQPINVLVREDTTVQEELPLVQEPSEDAEAEDAEPSNQCINPPAPLVPAVPDGFMAVESEEVVVVKLWLSKSGILHNSLCRFYENCDGQEWDGETDAEDCKTCGGREPIKRLWNIDDSTTDSDN